MKTTDFSVLIDQHRWWSKKGFQSLWKRNRFAAKFFGSCVFDYGPTKTGNFATTSQHCQADNSGKGTCFNRSSKHIVYNPFVMSPCLGLQASGFTLNHLVLIPMNQSCLLQIDQCSLRHLSGLLSFVKVYHTIILSNLSFVHVSLPLSGVQVIR
jgi:hypothetical protein